VGDGSSFTRRTTPVDVSGLTSGVEAMSAGALHTCALTTAHGVKCWGLNAFGELGDGTGSKQITPVDVSGLTSGVASVSAGGYHTCAVTTEGAVKCWGLNDDGEVGDGTTLPRKTPVDVSGLGSGVAAVSAGGGIPASGDEHTCALMTAGGVKCWGYDGYGQLGDGTQGTPDLGCNYNCRTTPVDVVGMTSGASEVSAGYCHT
jgi:alpha-tubulin suppressor-like RCC1 family protein